MSAPQPTDQATDQSTDQTTDEISDQHDEVNPAEALVEEVSIDGMCGVY